MSRISQVLAGPGGLRAGGGLQSEDRPTVEW
jgi:hypothetical protein